MAKSPLRDTCSSTGSNFSDKRVVSNDAGHCNCFFLRSLLGSSNTSSLAHGLRLFLELVHLRHPNLLSPLRSSTWCCPPVHLFHHQMIDGIHFGGQVLVVALGIAESGEKRVLGAWQGATENTTVVKGLLEDLVNRGLGLKQRYLVVMDGSKALRAGVERIFGDRVEVQRCQIHKRRNVKEYLPENCQIDYDRRMRNAYAMNNLISLLPIPSVMDGAPAHQP